MSNESPVAKEKDQSHENRKPGRKCREENVLHSYYSEENSTNENPAITASWEITGAENTK